MKKHLQLMRNLLPFPRTTEQSSRRRCIVTDHSLLSCYHLSTRRHIPITRQFLDHLQPEFEIRFYKAFPPLMLPTLNTEKHFRVSSHIREDNRFQLSSNHGCPFCPSFYEWWSYDQTSACGPPALPGTHPPHILSQAQLPQATLWAGRTGTGSV